MTNLDLDQLADRIREQAAASTRIGQMGDLYDLADEVQQAVAELREARATIERVRALAERWRTQPTDYDEDTEQQIADGHVLRAALDGER